MIYFIEFLFERDCVFYFSKQSHKGNECKGALKWGRVSVA